MKSLSRVQLLVTLWTAAYQAPPSMGFSRQEYRSGVLAFSSVPPPRALKFSLPETRDLQGSHIPDRWETTVQLINMPSAFQNLGSWGRRINVIDLADLLEGDGDRMNMPTSLKKIGPGTSLAVQRLRRRLPMQRVWVQSLVGELRSHLLH